MKKITNKWDHESKKVKPLTSSKIYTCFRCKYESNRRYNVCRHEERIHLDYRPRKCCSKMFYTKEDYYVHCEQAHSETRSNAIISRTKYKIAVEMDRTSNKCKKTPIPSRSDKNVKSHIRVKYSYIYTSFEIENIPLIYFLTDRRLKSYLKSFSSLKLINKTGDEFKKETKQSVKIAFSTKKSVKKSVSEDVLENVRTNVSNSNVSPFSIELPTKKLILKRFRTNVMRKFEMSLQETNNNVQSQVHLKEERQTTETVSFRQSRSKNSNRSTWEDKENISMFTVRMEEEELYVNVDKRITAPVATQLLRDYLSPIDFEKFKIF
ncbi:uncharacterized protein LOC128879898 [Hylaeus volcanicus]|uniref:uncharacterized protein LOC128879898 n=1 Tax=Hylaeus volcanicus TaxID=313075 RepID=UPI0023B879F7|nr:uncharacterized protein LOC128879898 [Hylaeus volcanicus]